MASDNYNSHKGGYTGLTFTETGGHFTFHGENGDVLYESSTFTSRKPVPTPPSPAPAPTPASTCEQQCSTKQGWIANKRHDDDTLEKISMSAEECCNRCASNPDCVTWDHTGKDNICRIKGGSTAMDDMSPNDQHQSGLRCVSTASVFV